MISAYNIKPKFQQLLKPILNLLFKCRVTANMITWAAIILSCFTGVIIWNHSYGIAFILVPILLLIRMALNALDGMMARNYNMQSTAGEILNELGDVVSDLFIYFPLLFLFKLNLYVLLVFLFLSVVNEFAGILAKAIIGTRRYDGPMGKSDRAFLVGIISLILYFNVSLLPYTNYAIIFASALLVVSTSVRILKTLKPD